MSDLSSKSLKLCPRARRLCVWYVFLLAAALQFVGCIGSRFGPTHSHTTYTRETGGARRQQLVVVVCAFK